MTADEDLLPVVKVIFHQPDLRLSAIHLR